MKTIHNHFRDITSYLDDTLDSMQNYLLYSKELSTHTDFNYELTSQMNTIENIRSKIKPITEYSIPSRSKIYVLFLPY